MNQALNQSIRRTCGIAHRSLSVCVSVCLRKVYCGKTAEWIQMLFRVVSEVSLDSRVGVLYGNCGW